MASRLMLEDQVSNCIAWTSIESDDSPFLAVSSFSPDANNSIDLLRVEIRPNNGTLIEQHSFVPTEGPVSKLVWAPSKFQRPASTCATLAYAAGETINVAHLVEKPGGAKVEMNECFAHSCVRRDERRGVEGDNFIRRAAKKVGPKSRFFFKHQQQLIGCESTETTSAAHSIRPPPTSIGWNPEMTHLLGAAYNNGVFCHFDLNTSKSIVNAELHDGAIYDLDYCDGHCVYTVGHDSELRLFDFRDSSSITIIGESTNKGAPMVRVGVKENRVFTLTADDTFVELWDTRVPGVPFGILKNGHSGAINCCGWNPHSASTLATGGYDNTVNIWGTESDPERYLVYDAPCPVNGLSWFSRGPDMLFIAIACESCVEVLTV